MVFGLFGKDERVVAIDLGSANIKLLELDCSEELPLVVSMGIIPVTGEIFNANVVSEIDEASGLVVELLESTRVKDKRVVTAVPGPSAFNKKIRIPKMALSEVASHVEMEAGNIIPHNINAVMIDYQLTKEISKANWEALVVAVKSEIIDSHLAVFENVGLKVAVVDVDYYSLQNMFEISYPELFESTICLINIGARYSSISIVNKGESLFTGDIPVGGRVFTESIAEGLGISTKEAEKLKLSNDPKSPYKDMVTEILNRSVEYVAGEINKHLSFFWKTGGGDVVVDRILVCGGSALIPNLTSEISEKTSLECSLLNPLRGVKIPESMDSEWVKKLSPLMGIAVGLGIRQAGDRFVPFE